MGFQAMLLVLVCMMSFRIGVDVRRSYRAMLLSDPAVAITSGSACIAEANTDGVDGIAFI